VRVDLGLTPAPRSCAGGQRPVSSAFYDHRPVCTRSEGKAGVSGNIAEHIESGMMVGFEVAPPSAEEEDGEHH
jgi:hypothetical protein